jgi:NADH:ubiquinone oxidoreductase subunit 6 (subunit J)
MFFNIIFTDLVLLFLLICSFVFTLQIYLFRNPIYSVFSFIIVISILMLINFIVGIEFFSLATLIIYIGAISILFLFVIMLLSRVTNNFLFFKNTLLICMIFLFFQYLIYLGIFSYVNFFYSFEFLFVENVEFSMMRFFDILFISTLYTSYKFEFFLVIIILFIGLLAPNLLTNRPTQSLMILTTFNEVILEHHLLFFTIIIFVYIVNQTVIYLYYHIFVKIMKVGRFQFLMRYKILSLVFVATTIYTLIIGYGDSETIERLTRIIFFEFILIFEIIVVTGVFGIYLDDFNLLYADYSEKLILLKKELNFVNFIYLILYMYLLSFMKVNRFIAKILMPNKGAAFIKIFYKEFLQDVLAVDFECVFELTPHMFLGAFGIIKFSLEMLGTFILISLSIAMYRLIYPNKNLTSEEIHRENVINLIASVTLLIIFLAILARVLPLLLMVSACPVPVRKLRYFYAFFICGSLIFLLLLFFFRKHFAGNLLIAVGFILIAMIFITVICMLLYMYFIDPTSIFK